MVRTDELPVALLAFLSIVVMAPVWLSWLGSVTFQRPETELLAMMLPAVVLLLFLSGWVKPELSGVVMGLVMLLGVVVMAPWFIRFTGMVAGEFTGHPLARTLVQLSVSLLVVSFLWHLANRRIRAAAQGGGGRR